MYFSLQDLASVASAAKLLYEYGFSQASSAGMYYLVGLIYRLIGAHRTSI